MNVEQFEHAMQAGLGRCYLELKNNPEKREEFKNSILWGITQELAYDTQSDGTMEEYMYRLINLYDDKSIFLKTLIRELKENDFYDTDWRFEHLIRLLSLFIKDNYPKALEALKDLYKKYFKKIDKSKREESIEAETDNNIYSLICLALYEYDKAYLSKIADDMGNLFNNTNLVWEDFFWFFGDMEQISEKELNKLKKSALTDDEKKYIDSFINSYKEFYEEETKLHENIEKNLKQKDNFKEEVKDDSSNEDEEMPIEKLLEELKQVNYKAKKLSEDLYKERTDPEAVNNSLKEVLNGGPSLYYISLLKNYEKVDLNILINYLNKLDVSYTDLTDWHSIIYYISKADEKNLNLPKEILYLAYEKSLCRGCRYRILQQLYDRNLLPDDIQKECYYDGNIDIIEFAKEHHFKR